MPQTLWLPEKQAPRVTTPYEPVDQVERSIHHSQTKKFKALKKIFLTKKIHF